MAIFSRRTSLRALLSASAIIARASVSALTKSDSAFSLASLSAFNFDNPEQVKLAFAPENHQWLLATDNFSKRDKYSQEDMEKLINIVKERNKD
jgi:hypothetical protein